MTKFAVRGITYTVLGAMAGALAGAVCAAMKDVI